VQLWTTLRDKPGETRQAAAGPIFGSDLRRDAVEFARTNARAAGAGHLLRFDHLDVCDFQPPPGPPGTLICNPPYGERLGEEQD